MDSIVGMTKTPRDSKCPACPGTRFEFAKPTHQFDEWNRDFAKELLFLQCAECGAVVQVFHEPSLSKRTAS